LTAADTLVSIISADKDNYPERSVVNRINYRSAFPEKARSESLMTAIQEPVQAAEIGPHRVTLLGEVPVCPDGRESELTAGKPFTSRHAVMVAD
jgi:hypothetical protein